MVYEHEEYNLSFNTNNVNKYVPAMLDPIAANKSLIQEKISFLTFIEARSTAGTMPAMGWMFIFF